MRNFESEEALKSEAKTILPILQQLFPDANVRLGQAIELLARRDGFTNWRAFKETLKAGKESQQDMLISNVAADVESDSISASETVDKPNAQTSPFRAPIYESREDFLAAIKEDWEGEPQELKLKRIDLEDYRLAVERLIEVTRMHGTSGAKAAALVLLSTYNGQKWHVDLTDLCSLSGQYYDAAIAVIRGRVECSYEPHKLVEDGSAVFSELWDRFNRYHITNAWKITCYDCNGQGWVYVDPEDDSNEETESCWKCGGEGLSEE